MSSALNPRSAAKDDFLDQAKSARMERHREKEQEAAAILIQALARGYISRNRFRCDVIEQFDSVFIETVDTSELKPLAQAIDVFQTIKKFLFVFDPKKENHRFERMCRYIVSSLLMPKFDPKFSYVSVGCSKEHSLAWISQVKTILMKCTDYIKTNRPEISYEHKAIMLYLNMILLFTSCKTWSIPQPLKPAMQKLCSNIASYLTSHGLLESLQSVLLKGLCRSRVSLKKTDIAAAVSIAVRCTGDLSESSINRLLLHILSVPGLVHHLVAASPESIKLLKVEERSILNDILDFLSSEQNSRILFNMLQANYGLCLVANVIHLADLEKTVLEERPVDFISIVQMMLQNCQKYVVNKQSSLTHWHPILGWFSHKDDPGLHESLGPVKSQLALLWSSSMVTDLFKCLIIYNEKSRSQALHHRTSISENFPLTNLSTGTTASSVWRKAFDKAALALTKSSDNSMTSASSGPFRKLGSPEVATVSLVCSMYTTALATLTQMRLDILTGICYHEVIMTNLWTFLSSLGPRNGLIAYLDHLALSTKTCAPEFQMLVLFCDCATHLITILDDIEIYEKQEPFTLSDFCAISSFLNHFVFRLIWNNLIDLKNLQGNALFNSAHTLLMILYKRDCRRKYASDDHWLIKDLKVSTFLKDLENAKKSSQILMQKVPHIIPHKDRVLLFRKHVLNERAVLGLTDSACNSPHSTMITVHRARVLEDGYQQLAALPVQSLKGIIRVKFINEQGLDEAGIDQDGVFKEFLEETVKKVFDPSLNLFRATSEQRLYPSPTSFVHENHLSLFEFVGKVLGKAVYEGIVIDVPFASFFLGQVLGQQQSVLYSSIDELPSLDAELYKNLTYIKHYDGDVADLGLTFSVDEDCMGKIVTHELMPGGRAVPVTKETRINYIHLMAHFRMHTQIRDQTAAFIRGFRLIVNPEWLAMFATPEFQRLISGDNMPIDLVDLRRNTKYYGGFHNNHRVISWLWDILEKDFNAEEHRRFLKFVTSCSKPPLLGFTHLEPPFSIRCVEVGDDQDIGDTVGSVLRGFFTIRRKDPVNRLPTSSTCFNLLKLPNYQKRSTLRDKLRYAILSNTGFELS
ncbi:Ubiquitin-protein ligase E3B [Halotydeus destructor]|nr:Ubiquitin-protein ligase E3B [Halotydeus destructor]